MGWPGRPRLGILVASGGIWWHLVEGFAADCAVAPGGSSGGRPPATTHCALLSSAPSVTRSLPSTALLPCCPAPSQYEVVFVSDVVCQQPAAEARPISNGARRGGRFKRDTANAAARNGDRMAILHSASSLHFNLHSFNLHSAPILSLGADDSPLLPSSSCLNVCSG